MRRFVKRHQPPQCRIRATKAGLGALAGIAFVAWLGDVTGAMLLVAPFGATCVLLFALPDSPLSQPMNVICGHLMATAVSLAVDAALPPGWWSMALAVGLVIALMSVLRITHPPAGADPLVVLAIHPGIEFLIYPMLLGSAVLVAVATLVHRLPPRVAYPLPVATEREEPVRAEA